MCLRFVFLLITRVAAGLRLSRREEMWKTAEILILRHQLAVLQRRQPLRPKLDWADRALLAALLGVIPKARRRGLRLLVTPDTIVRWHRDIVRRRWAARSACGRTGRPATRRNIRALVRRLARENPGWGYRRIHGELAGLGIKVAASTVWEILKASGMDPGRRQTGPTWPQFLRSQAEAILACDFFTVDLLGGTQAYVLAVIEHATRRIRIIGITLHPTGEWTAQQARNLIMDLGEHAGRVKFLIRDRGSNFTTARRRPGRRRGPDRALQRPDAAHERDHRTLDRGLPPRASGPHPHLEPGTSSAKPARLRDPSQSAPPAPLPVRRRAAETATRAGRPRPVPHPKTGSRR
jgi:putative transposase